jgi:hypothetical protein
MNNELLWMRQEAVVKQLRCYCCIILFHWENHGIFQVMMGNDPVTNISHIRVKNIMATLTLPLCYVAFTPSAHRLLHCYDWSFASLLGGMRPTCWWLCWVDMCTLAKSLYWFLVSVPCMPCNCINTRNRLPIHNKVRCSVSKVLSVGSFRILDYTLFLTKLQA